MPRNALSARLWIVAAALIAYATSFASDFQLDDYPAILSNPRLAAPPGFAAMFTGPAQSTAAGRPILNLTFYINYRISGPAVWSYHAFNLLLHLANALLVFALGLRLQKLHRIFPGRAALAGPFAAALLWAVHPLGTAAVTYVVQRAEALVILFFLLSLLIHLMDDAARRRAGVIAAQAACLLSGLFTKEVMAAAIPVFLVCDLAAARQRGGSRRIFASRNYYLALLGALLVFALYYKGMPRGASAGFGLRRTGPLDYAFNQLHIVWIYLFRFFWPAWQVFDYGPFQNPGVVATLLCASASLAAFAFAVWTARRRPMAFVALAGTALILLPTTSFIPLLDAYFEHRAYGPAAALILLLASAAARVRPIGKTSARLAAGSLVLAALACTVLTARRNLDYSSQETMASDVLLKRPRNPRAALTLGEIAEVRGDFAAAERHYLDALKINPGIGYAQLRLALLYSARGRHADALPHYELALRAGLPPNVTPDQTAVIHNNLGVAYGESGRGPEAVAAYREALRLNPGYSDAKANLDLELRLGGQKPQP